MRIDYSNESVPLVTWVLCTHRVDSLLHRAVQSCLSQTVSDFELLLVVNGPDVEQLVSKLREVYCGDNRIKIVGTQIHLLNFSLSLGIHLARSPFIARLDADDVSHPERLETQLAYMQANSDVAVLGSAYLLIDDQGSVHGRVDTPQSDFAIRRALRYGNPICHPSVMLRREAVLTEGGYLGGKNAEDYDLWLRFATGNRWQFANLSVPLLSYNMSPDGQARRSRTAYANVAGAQIRQFLLTRDIRWFIGAAVSIGKSLFRSNRP